MYIILLKKYLFIKKYLNMSKILEIYIMCYKCIGSYKYNLLHFSNILKEITHILLFNEKQNISVIIFNVF